MRVTVLLAESEEMLQRTVDEFDKVCRRVKVNAGKSKVMVFERATEETTDFAKPYRVGSEAMTGCKIWLGKEKMEEVTEFKYLGTILCKHGRRDKGENSKGWTDDVCIGKSYERKKCKHGGKKKGIRNSVILLTLS